MKNQKEFNAFSRKIFLEIAGSLAAGATMTSAALGLMKVNGLFEPDVIIEKHIEVQTVEVETPVIVMEKYESIESYEIPTSDNYLRSDIDLMARVVMSESSVLDLDAKQAVAETIINRVESDLFPNTVAAVVYQENAYSTQDNGEPTYECYLAVENAINNDAFPDNMFYFRTDHYHDFGTPLCKIDEFYFSTN